MDQYTEVRKVSWIKRFFNALLGFIFAPLLFVASFMALKHGELRHAQTTFGLKDIIHEVVEPEYGRKGDLLHITDVLNSPAEWLVDEETGLDVKALKLYRKVYNWQWVEIKKTKKKNTINGQQEEITYKYVKKWVCDFQPLKRIQPEGHQFDHHRFKYKEGHENKDFKPYASKLITHKEIKFGNYALAKDMQDAVLNFELLPAELNMFKPFDFMHLDSISYAECPAEEVRRKTYNKGQNTGSSNYGLRLKTSSLFLGAGNPEIPEIGDSRLEYWYIPDGVYSIIAQKKGNSLGPIENDSLFIRSDLPCGGMLQVHNKKFALLFAGTHTINEIFEKTHKENDIYYMFLRFWGLLIMVAAFALFGNPVRILFGWIPFIGAIWEKAVYKLMQLLGTFTAICISIFYFLKYNSFSNLTVYDFYFGVAVLLFLLFAHNLRVSIHSGEQEVFSDTF